MSCWVVPTIAAELWGVPLQNVLDSVKAGRVPCKTESGFTFVDVAPSSPTFQPSRQRRAKPPTFNVVTREEVVALTGQDGDEFSADLGDWREARSNARKRRRAPIAA
jgi:hypothetical protein